MRTCVYCFSDFSAVSFSTIVKMAASDASDERVEIDLLQPEILSKECLLELLKHVCDSFIQQRFQLWLNLCVNVSALYTKAGFNGR